MDEITSVSYSTTKEETVKDSPRNWTDLPVLETMQDNCTFCLDDNNTQERLLNDSVDGNTPRTQGNVSYYYHMHVDSQRKAEKIGCLSPMVSRPSSLNATKGINFRLDLD